MPKVILSQLRTPVQGQSQTRAGRPWHAEHHIVTSQVEHSSVLNYCMALERPEAPLLIQEGWRASAGVVTAGSRSGGFTPPFSGGDSTSPHGGVKPPLPSSVARTCSIGPRRLGSVLNLLVTCHLSLVTVLPRPIYALCCAEGSGERNDRARLGAKNRRPQEPVRTTLAIARY